MTIDRESHSYLLGVAEAEIAHYREILSDLVKVTGADLRKLPEGYRGRYAIDRADAKLSATIERTLALTSAERKP